MTKDVVSRRDVEIEVWQREVEQIVRALQLHFSPAARKNRNLALLTSLDLFGRYRLDELNCFRGARLQFVECLFVILHFRIFDLRDARGEAFGGVTGALNL